MRIIIIAALLSSCVGMPDRLEVEVGRSDGGFTNPKGAAWDQEGEWVALTLGFPITYGGVECRRVAPCPTWAPAPAAPQPREAAIVPAEKPWWRDVATVQSLVLLAAGAAAGGFGGPPAVQKCKTALAERRKRKSA